MKTSVRLILCVVFSMFSSNVSGQNTDSVADKLIHYIRVADQFSKSIPRENVYLHFDNTSYYHGDNIWFSCYITTSDFHLSTEMSKTLYVELLNPGGEQIDKLTLKIENGRCHGNFILNKLPFYSGFYELRAYTKYMLNFGEDAIFSRLFPVFDMPKERGNYDEKSIRRYGTGDYPMIREKPDKVRKVNLKFFPEGGNSVIGLQSQVAFEATDSFGNPIDVSGTIVNDTGEIVSRFSSSSLGRGILSYVPISAKQKAQVVYDGSNYKFDLPTPLDQGYVLKVDNLSSPDSISLAINKSKTMQDEMLGLVVISRGKVYNFCLLDVNSNTSIRFKIDKTKLPTGVSNIVLFNSNGNIISERLVFTGREELLNIKATTPKEFYKPFEAVDMEFAVTDISDNPIPTEFSVSVRDGINDVESSHNILTNFLLESQLKGYIRNPSYYFEATDLQHRMALDQLLMVQGWRSSSLKQMAGVEPFVVKYMPEQGIEINGKVITFVREIPKPDVDISFVLLKNGDDETKGGFVDTFVSDSLGRFAFVTDVKGKWNMILSVAEKGKKKDYRIILDRVFSPAARKYQYSELQITLPDTSHQIILENNESDVTKINADSLYNAYVDSLVGAPTKEKIYRIDEVKITGKKRSQEREIYNNRAKSVAYYDVDSGLDDIKDSGKYIGSDIHQYLLSTNKNFMSVSHGDYLSYKSRMPLFVINYTPTMHNEFDYNKYKLIRLEAIKSIYINEELNTICRYADPILSPLSIDKLYGCVVFIETYPEDQVPAPSGKGVRKTHLEGYSLTKEFYSPDYSILPPDDTDYRRTLYWNPAVVTDSLGKAKIQFYNNSRCKKLTVSAETITSQGKIGVCRP